MQTGKFGGVLQSESQPRSSSHHAYLTYRGHGGRLRVLAGGLDRLLLGQETSSVNQTGRRRKANAKQLCIFSATGELTGDKPGGHGPTEGGATVEGDVSVAVRVGDALAALPRPRTFNLSQGGRRSVLLSSHVSPKAENVSSRLRWWSGWRPPGTYGSPRGPIWTRQRRNRPRARWQWRTASRDIIRRSYG